MEAHGRLVRVRARQRAEPAEGPLGRVLVELPDGAGHLRLDVVSVAPRCLVEHPRGRDRPPHALEADPVEELLVEATPARREPERLELARGRKARDRRRRAE